MRFTNKIPDADDQAIDMLQSIDRVDGSCNKKTDGVSVMPPFILERSSRDPVNMEDILRRVGSSCGGAVQFGTYFDDLPEYPKRTLQQYRFAPLGSTNELDGEQIAGEATTKRCVVASPQDQAIPRNENERNDLTENRDSTCSFFQDTDVKHPSTLHEELSRRLLQLSGWQQLILCLMA